MIYLRVTPATRYKLVRHWVKRLAEIRAEPVTIEALPIRNARENAALERLKDLVGMNQN